MATNRTHIETCFKGMASVAHHFIITLILGAENGTTTNKGFSCNWNGGKLTDSYLIAI